MEERRPDPDLLLAKVQQEEERRREGQLKIFFRRGAGRRQTYAMLSAASRN